MHEEPLHLVPERFRDDVADAAQRRPRSRTIIRRKINGELCPFCRYVYTERLKHYDGDWTRVVQDVRVKRLILSEKDRIGIGTFQPKDEKNQDSHRADRRHQLSQDRRIWQRQRSAGLQFRRRVQHRQPRDHRVRRSAEARRGVPLRPAGRQPGAQGQAEEIRPDRHRRSDPRPHERARISPLAEQRVHGSPARPDGEDRRALRHHAGRRDQDLREGLQPRQGAGQAHRPAHDRNGRHVGHSHAAGRAEERRACRCCKSSSSTTARALPGFTEDNIKELREQAVNEGMHGISPRYVQDKISNALVAHPDAKSINPFMVLNELEAGPQAPQPDHQRGNPRPLPRAAGRGQGGVREHREERSATGHRRRRRRPEAALRQLHRQREGLHAAGKGAATSSPANTRSPTNG